MEIKINGNKEISICWFRRDLRLNDHAAFYHALKSEWPVLPLFIFDSAILDQLPSKEDKRVMFIYQEIEKLYAKLKGHNSLMLVMHGKPLDVFKEICKKYKVKGVFTNHDYEPYAIERDAQVKEFLATKNISFQSFKDQVIFEGSEILKADGTPYNVFTPYSNAWKKMYAEEKPSSYPSEKNLKGLLHISPVEMPSLQSLGFKKVSVDVPPMKPDNEIIKHYHKTRNLPAEEGTSRMSIHLRFGTVSIRQMVALAQELNETWLNELIWREFFMMILYHYPHVVNQSFKKKYDHIKWRNNEKEFDQWCRGETGYAMVDAGMRQLNETGWMHNRVRMVVASFLTKHLLIDWRWGEAYFAEKLLDYELSSNNGNWQWAAGSGCDAAPYFRIFNPKEQQKKFDPKEEYIKTWIKDYKPGYLEPIVEHAEARKRALDVYKKSLDDAG